MSLTWDELAANLTRELTRLPDNAIGSIFGPDGGLLNFRQGSDELHLEMNRRGEPVWEASIEWPVGPSELRPKVDALIAEAEARGYPGPEVLRFRAWNEGSDPEPGRAYSRAELAALRGGDDIDFNIGIARAQ